MVSLLRCLISGICCYYKGGVPTGLAWFREKTLLLCNGQLIPSAVGAKPMTGAQRPMNGAQRPMNGAKATNERSAATNERSAATNERSESDQ